MNRKQVEAQYLSKGDVLCSGGVVTDSPWRDSGLNSQKIYIGIDGFRRTWNKRTKIAVVQQ